MGHGTEHSADESYMIIEQALRAYARHPVYIATVEGKRTIQDVIRQMKDEGIVNTRVVIAPFMLVAVYFQSLSGYLPVGQRSSLR